MKTINIKGARTHNLKNIDVVIPRDKLVVITGLSGSGKSSLAFDTLYAEGQRRYVESLSTYARQFLSVMEKPDVDHIEGLSPAISIEQKSTSHNPRSTVGTITEIYDYIRLLFARVGTPRCPKHKISLEAKTISQMVDQILELKKNTKIMILAPIISDRKGEHIQLLESLQSQGYIRAKIDGEIYELDNPPKLSLHKKHTIEVVIDRLIIKNDIKTRLADSLETTIKLSLGIAKVVILDLNSTNKNDELNDTKDKENNNSNNKINDKENDELKNANSKNNQEIIFSAKYSCHKCGYSLQELEPKIFSFNNPAGACSKCDGLGQNQSIDPEKVIYDTSFSLSEGAIRGWDKNSFYYFSMLTSLSKHYNFSLDTPYNKLPKKIKDILLYGSKGEFIKFKFKHDNAQTTTREFEFEGIINNMERRYQETESQYVREELSKFLTKDICTNCNGSRLSLASRNVFVDNHSILEITNKSIIQAVEFFKNLKLKGNKAKIAKKILKEIITRLEFLVNVGLDYLTLGRNADSLSGGEAQRIRLASQIGAGLVGVMYVLDEPSIGLHQKDNERLIKTLTHLKNLGNTVIVVEHDEGAILAADYVIDIGPLAGVHGGEIVAKGTPSQIMKNNNSLTGKYLAKKENIEIPKKRNKINNSKMLVLEGASGNNLKNITVKFPIGVMTCITGVSGSGKSTLVNDTLYPISAQNLNGAINVCPDEYANIEGLEHLDKVVDISQSPIGRTPRSNAATYTGLFTDIRDLFAKTPEARSRGYKIGRFSFNVKGGRCEACCGDGLIKVEMHFLPDIYVMCDVCKGKRYNRETLEIFYKGKNIHEVLDLTVEDAHEFFTTIPSIKRKLSTLIDVGLGYIKLGQSATTLSGGEAQRVKLSKELSRRDTGNTLYILDEPTTGLHFHDVKKLLHVLNTLRKHGNTIIIIEHNMDVIKTADWIIDLGPLGGDNGGTIVAQGTPEEVAKNNNSFTGQFLKDIL